MINRGVKAPLFSNLSIGRTPHPYLGRNFLSTIKTQKIMKNLKNLTTNELSQLENMKFKSREPRLMPGDTLEIKGVDIHDQKVVVDVTRDGNTFEARFWWKFLIRQIYSAYVFPDGQKHYQEHLRHEGEIVEILSHCGDMREYIFKIPKLKVIQAGIREGYIYKDREYIPITYLAYGFVAVD